MLKRTITGFAALSLFLLWFGAGSLVQRAGAEDEALLVIVGTSFPAKDVSFAVLKEAFRGRAASLEGKRLIPVNHPNDSPPRVLFDKLVLRLKPAEVGRFWVDVKIRDDGKPPTTAGTSELAVRIVASLPSSISYAPRSLLNPKVKVLTIDGKSATDADYPLKAK